MKEALPNIEVLLASKSPRRKALLEDIGLQFKLVTIELEEYLDQSLTVEELAKDLARKKAQAYTGEIKENQVLLTADTLVSVDGELLGKPSGESEAFSMLAKLSGKVHKVTTAVCLKNAEKEKLFEVSSLVTFKDLSPELINYYIQKFKPFDKAGAYGIQEWIGMVGISNVDGDYYNVVGLPVSKVFDELSNW